MTNLLKDNQIKNYLFDILSSMQGQNKIQDLFYPTIMILRQEKEVGCNYKVLDKDVVIQTPEGEELLRISASVFLMEAEKLLRAINENDGAFAIPQIEALMNEFYCHSLKAKSSDKADIRIILRDLRTNMSPILGFSIKSQLGSASTLLNPGTATNIQYRIVGHDLSDEDITAINSIEEHIPRMEKIADMGCSLEYETVLNETFRNNLIFLDTCMPQFIAECLIVASMPGAISDVKDAVQKVADKNPFNFKGSKVRQFYEHKMKMLLLDAALGMTPAREWAGRYDANGGYLVVRKDGEIVCYHFYNRNDVEDYLFNNTRFERASRSRYNFGSVYKAEDGLCYINLNLQIRFKK